MPSPSCWPTAWTLPAASAYKSSSSRPHALSLSSNTFSVQEKPIVDYYCPGGFDGYTTPGSASQAGPGLSLSSPVHHHHHPPAVPPTTLGCICRDPYRPGTSLLYSFVFIPSLILQHPHRGTALFYPDASVSQTLIHPPHPGVSTPVWAKTNLVPSLPLSISRGLTTPGSPLLPHTSFPPRREYVHPQLSAPSPEDSTSSPSFHHRPGLFLSSHSTHPYGQSSLLPRQQFSWNKYQLAPKPRTSTHTHPRMCDFTKNYYIYSSCLDPGAHFFRTSVDGNRKLACPKGPHERYIVQPGTCPLCSG